MSHCDCDQHLQAAAYLLGALAPTEAEDYREHLQGCASCREEIEQLAPAANALPAGATPIRAPDELRQAVMKEVRAEAELLRAAGPQADRPPARAHRSRPRLRLALLAASFGIAAAVIAVLMTAGSPPSPRVTQARLAANIPGSAEVRQSGTGAELVVSGIPQPPAGKIYEMWLAKPHQPPRPTEALFSVAADGDASVNVPGGLHGIQTLLVTAEPAGGSAHPTSPPIITATLKTA